MTATPLPARSPKDSGSSAGRAETLLRAPRNSSEARARSSPAQAKGQCAPSHGCNHDAAWIRVEPRA